MSIARTTNSRFIIKPESDDVKVLTSAEVVDLVKNIENNTLCGVGLDKGAVIQRLVDNPVLFYGRKVDFRLYMIIQDASKMTVKFVQGFARVCRSKFDISSTDSAVHVSNLRLGYSNIDRSSLSVVDDESVKTFQEVQSHLKTSYGIEFIDRVGDIKRQVRRLLEGSKMAASRDSSSIQLFAIDFIVTDSNQALLLEINAFPSMTESSSRKSSIYKRVMQSVARTLEAKIKGIRSRIKKQINDSVFDYSQTVRLIDDL